MGIDNCYNTLLNKAPGVMLASTIINHRQHVGLQKLSALAGITHSSLGPNKTFKFIQDEASGESALACSCFRILENLEPTCGVGQLVYETIRAHQEVYHTGSGCLLFLAGAWSRGALECLQRGVSVAHIISAMSEGMEVCLDACRKCSFSTEGLGGAQSDQGPGLHLAKKPTVEAPQASCRLRGTREAGGEALNASGRRKVKLSRHFYETRSDDVSTVPQPPRPELPDVAHIAAGLSHGCVNAMNLVVEAGRIQSPGVSCSTFDVTKVVTCVLPGLPEEHACVLQGCVLLVSDEQASVAHHLKEQHLKVALINGDLSDTYRHLGFKRLKGVQGVHGVQGVRDRSHLSSSNKEGEWLEQTVTLLLDLEVNLVVVSGLAGEEVIQRCCRHRILVVDKAKAPIVKALAAATGAVPVTYATQLSRRCVGAGAKAAMWRELRRREGKPSTAVNISTADSSGLVTVILTSCVDGKLQALQDQFWACAYRLHHALTGRVLLPGAGVTEALCVRHLQKEAESHVGPRRGTAANPYRGLVWRLMADGLLDYVATVMVNTGRFSKLRARTAVSQQLQANTGSAGIAATFSRLFLAGEREDGGVSAHVESGEAPAVQVYDSLIVKQEAWRKALDLVLLVLQTDAEVITGLDPKADGGQGTLMLL